METTNLSARSSPEREAELLELIRSFRIAQDSGDPHTALRLIDRAWRIASHNPEINYLYGLWLVHDGQARKAISLLETAAAGGNDPNIEAVFISALCSDGQIARARDRIDDALAKFAVALGSPLAQIARQVSAVCRNDVAGWIAVAPDLTLHGELTGEDGSVPLRIVGENSAPHDILLDCGGADFKAFAVANGSLSLIGMVQAHVHGLPLLGSGLLLPPNFILDGRVTIAETGISGWAMLPWDPSYPLKVTLSGDSDVIETTDARHDALTGHHHFAFEPGDVERAGNRISIMVAVPNGTVMPLPGSPYLAQPGAALAHARSSTASKARPGTQQIRKVDIVIPVYKGFDETLNCIKSVQKTVGPDAHVVVIDDASPDPKIRQALDALARMNSIELLRNPTNLGFPGTVNRGLCLHPDRDVVILNADTEVYGDWLVRLKAAAYSGGDIGTVTPMTNSGSIASYPQSEEPELDGKEAADRDALFAKSNAGLSVEVPTGVGFCMYVRRDCIDDVGLLDTETFSQGYGEENDFCLRASAVGWKHLLAADTYVRHIGSRSFGGARAALFDRNIRLLNLRYPGYDEAIRSYNRRDPGHGIRRRIDEARLLSRDARFVLLVTLALPGGVRRAVEERASRLRGEGFEPIILKPDIEHAGRCVLVVDGQKLEDLYFDRDDSSKLLELLGKLTLSHIELHHILDLPPALIDGLFELGLPVDIQVHDYVWYCPRINLLDEDANYCGEPGPAGCRACIKRNGTLFADAITIDSLRKQSKRWLSQARHVRVPAPSVAKRMAVPFPGVAYEVEPLEESPPAMALGVRRHPILKVAVIGAIGGHKGFDLLLAMAKDVVGRDLPIEFVVIGYTQDDKALFDTGRVFVTGEYDEAELEQLIARERPDIALFISRFPETWSYALTHAMRAQLPVAGLDFGAIGDRLRGMPDASLLFPQSVTADALNDGLLRAFDPSALRQTQMPQAIGAHGAGSGSDKPDILANLPTPQSAEQFLRRDMATTSNLPSASVEFLPLSLGLYLFSVKSDQGSYRVDEQNGISLPAIQISMAPGSPAGQVELILSPRTPTAWLSEPHDQIVVKVNVPSAVVLLTSVVMPGMTPIELEVQRLDRGEITAIQTGAVQAEPARLLPPLPAMQPSVPLKVTPHIQNRGDVAFSEGQWAGAPMDGFWIESIAIEPLAELAPEMIEYKAMTATGVETPWVSGGVSCGTRGIGVPLIGVAIRIKPQAAVENGLCEYGAILLSGQVIGPVRNGVPCRSADDGDAICGIWVSISGKSKAIASGAAASSGPTAIPSEGATSGSKKASKASERPKAPIGPRFSAFREQSSSE